MDVFYSAPTLDPTIEIARTTLSELLRSHGPDANEDDISGDLTACRRIAIAVVGHTLIDALER